MFTIIGWLLGNDKIASSSSLISAISSSMVSINFVSSDPELPLERQSSLSPSRISYSLNCVISLFLKCSPLIIYKSLPFSFSSKRLMSVDDVDSESNSILANVLH